MKPGHLLWGRKYGSGLWVWGQQLKTGILLWWQKWGVSLRSRVLAAVTGQQWGKTKAQLFGVVAFWKLLVQGFRLAARQGKPGGSERESWQSWAEQNKAYRRNKWVEKEELNRNTLGSLIFPHSSLFVQHLLSLPVTPVSCFLWFVTSLSLLF